NANVEAAARRGHAPRAGRICRQGGVAQMGLWVRRHSLPRLFCVLAAAVSSDLLPARERKDRVNGLRRHRARGRARGVLFGEQPDAGGPMNARARLLRAAVGFALVREDEPELRLLHRWLDSWRGIGDIVVGMARHGCDLQLTDYDAEHWPATF